MKGQAQPFREPKTALLPRNPGQSSAKGRHDKTSSDQFCALEPTDPVHADSEPGKMCFAKYRKVLKSRWQTAMDFSTYP